MVWVRSVAAAVAVLALCGCASGPGAGTATTTAAPASGLYGMATQGPTQPVCQEGQPCSGPYQGPLEAVGGDGAVHAFATAQDGSFNVTLPPGHYTLRGPPDRSLPRCAGGADVPAGAYVRVDVMCDTGIR